MSLDISKIIMNFTVQVQIIFFLILVHHKHDLGYKSPPLWDPTCYGRFARSRHAPKDP